MVGRCTTCSSLIEGEDNFGTGDSYLCKPCFDKSDVVLEGVSAEASSHGTNFYASTPRSNMGAGALTAILMMVGAVIWFVVGYMAGYIYYYPPILFLIGLYRLFKSFSNR